jgi:hypothetical protein
LVWTVVGAGSGTAAVATGTGKVCWFTSSVVSINFTSSGWGGGDSIVTFSKEVESESSCCFPNHFFFDLFDF